MEKKSLKSIVIGYKLSGLSYSDIATELEKEYGIKMSRQAINGLYKRATSDKEVEKNIQTVLNTTDICYYSTLGYTVKEIKEIIQTDSFDLSINKISEILDNNKDLIENIEKSIVEKIKQGINDKKSIDDMIQSLRFKGISVKNKKWEYLLDKAADWFIDDSINKSLIHLLDVTDNRGLVREKMKKHGLGSSIRDLSQRVK